MKQAKIFLLASVFMLLSSGPALHAEEGGHPWELKRDKEGIRVEVRKVDGSPILEYRGTMTLDYPAETVVAFFERDEKIAEWFHNCKSSRLIRQDSADRKILYFELEMPWPVSNRDAAYARERTLEAGGVTSYSVKALPDEIPREEGKIRMPYLKGTWRFTPVAGNRTEVYLQQHGDAAGHLPAALINRLAVDIPFRTLHNLREILSREIPAA